MPYVLMWPVVMHTGYLLRTKQILGTTAVRKWCISIGLYSLSPIYFSPLHVKYSAYVQALVVLFEFFYCYL